MKKFLAILTLALFVFTSCDEEPLIFDSNGGQTLVNFGSSAANLQIVIDATGSVDIPINVSTVSDSDRSFPVRVASATADPNSFSVGTVTIAAGAFNGTLTVNGTDVNVDPEPETVVIEFDTSAGDFVTDGPVTVSVFQICPVATSAFVGDYAVQTITAGVFGASTYGGDGNIVSITVSDDDPLTREFEANYFEDGRFPRAFLFQLVCNEVITPFQDHLVGCGGNDVNLNTGPADVNGTYDPNDDSEFIVNVTDNVDSDCGGGPVQASYRFVKQ